MRQFYILFFVQLRSGNSSVALGDRRSPRGRRALRALLGLKAFVLSGLVFSPCFGAFGEFKKFPLLPARPPALHRKLRAFALSPSLAAEPSLRLSRL